MEEEGVGARREGAAGVVVDGRVRAAGREGDGEREDGEALAGASSPRLAHREGAGGGGRRRRRRVQRLLRYREFGDGRFEVARWRCEPVVKVWCAEESESEHGLTSAG